LSIGQGKYKEKASVVWKKLLFMAAVFQQSVDFHANHLI
jgi:hypothetical protein